MRVLLVRHTPVNLLDGVCYGRSDVELAPDWSLHCANTRDKLPRGALDEGWIYSSPLRRCLDLANMLGDEVIADERLREMDFGSWELRRWNEIPEAEMQAWTSAILRTPPPGGESLLELHERCREFFEELRGHGHDTVILVTHGGVIRCLLAQFLGLAVPNAFRLRVDYGSVSQVRITPQVVQVDFVNR